MATVYLAVQESFQRQVALKIMSPELAREQDFSERFLREARIVSQLVHPNIVTVHDVGIDNGHHYLSMEFVDGKDLKEVLPELSAEQIFRVLREVAIALDYAGGKGYVHRDVKPENIMLHSHDGRAVLMDFGIARASRPDNSMTRTGTALGTPHYMSPEQARGAEVDARSDLYSLGVLFYYLLVGKVPFEADSPVAVGIKHVTEPVPTLPVPLACYQPLLNKMMAKKPEQRFQTGWEVRAALEKLPTAPLEQWHQRKDFTFQTDRRDTPVRNAITEVWDDFAVSNEVLNASTRIGATTNARKTASATDPGEALHIPQEDLAARTTRQQRSSVIPMIIILLVATAGGAYYFFPAEVRRQLDNGLALLDELQGKAMSTDGNQSTQVSSDSAESGRSTSAAGQANQNKGLSTVAKPDPLDELWLQVATVAEQVVEQPQRRGNLVDLYRQILAVDPANAKALAALETQKSNAISEAQTLLNNGQLDAAEASLATLLNWFPELADQQAYTQLQKGIARATEIQSLLTQAEHLLSENKLLKPDGENAVETYRAVLNLDAANSAALSGLDKIVARYQQLAINKQKKADFQQALNLVGSGLVLAPNNGDLKQLKAQLQRQLQTQAAIEHLLAEAKTLSTQGRLFSNDDGAVKRYQQVIAIDAKNTEANTELQAIMDDRYRLVEQNLSSHDYRKATAQVEEALALMPSDERLMGLLLEIESNKPAIAQLLVSGTVIDSMVMNQPGKISADRTLYFAFHYKNMVNTTTVFEATLFDGSRALQIAAVPVVVRGKEGDTQFRIDRPVEGFTEGGYHIDIQLTGRRIYTRAFTIAK